MSATLLFERKRQSTPAVIPNPAALFADGGEGPDFSSIVLHGQSVGPLG
jgi:hypothetical protein